MSEAELAEARSRRSADMKRILFVLLLVLAGLAPAKAQISECPDDFVVFAGTTEALTCTCDAQAATRGAVWGMGVYTGDSSICRAALHAGAITRRGGQVTVMPEAGRSAYPGSTRNGVSSSNFGAFGSSFRFALAEPPGKASGAGAADAPAPAAGQAASAECPDDFAALADTDAPLTCTCSPEATARGSVWGMDVYTADSAICRAALHAGAVTRRGGQVTLTPEPGRSAYPGVTRNGVASSNFGTYGSSFRFAGGGAGAAASSGGPVTLESCPDNFSAFANTTDPVICTCDAQAVARGSVWGMDVYTADSSICRAALHAGAVTRQGGRVTVTPEAGRPAYAGATRNGLSSSNFASYEASFRFGPLVAGPTICPDNFAAFQEAAEQLVCTCDAQAVTRGAVWGTDVYTTDSAICRAALHAGAVPRQGGQVTVIPEAGRNAYPGLTRNGVQSSNYGTYDASFRFPPRPGAARVAAAPAQQNIQQGLRDRGEVDLYVQFRFNSAVLDLSAADTLRDLLAVLTGDGGLRLALIGHTDSVGTADYNKSLSYRRAEAVRDWLVQQGVAASRFTVDGHGREQPIADNNTEAGRAANRRVQARRL